MRTASSAKNHVPGLRKWLGNLGRLGHLGRLSRSVLACLAITVVLAGAAWWLIPCFCRDNIAYLRALQTPVREYYDANGELLFLERTYDGQWRFDVPLEAISPVTVQTMLATEDRRFYEHGGLDWHSFSRAAWQLLRNGRIISGGSTITMQLAGLGDSSGRRSLPQKIRQVFRARKLERLYSKDTILQEYLNRIPFGGKIYGIEAAARFYFRKSSANLTQGEAAMLCGLPQKPNAYRPDRHPVAASHRLYVVLYLLIRHGLLSEADMPKCAHEALQCLAYFPGPSPFSRFASPHDTRMFLASAQREAGTHLRINTSLQQEYQQILLRCLRRKLLDLPGVADGAAVLIDNQTAQVLALVGTLNWHSPRAGQVDATRASRVAGSTLKPFIYAEAINGGLLTAETMLLDTPVRYGNYLPENYDRNFRGPVPADEALSLSLNLPAIRLLATLGVDRMAETLQDLSLLAPGIGYSEQDGLSLALGTSGHTLLSLTAAYAALASHGHFRSPSFLTQRIQGDNSRQVFLPETAALVSQMLRTHKLRGTSLPLAWKTGTSNGNHDAWCFAYTPDYTLGVWFGNKTGQAAAVLIGSEAAAPCAAAVFEAIYRDRRPTAWPSRDEYLQETTICQQSGLRASPACPEQKDGFAVRGIPLAICRQCQSGQQRQPLQILSPRPTNYQCRHGESSVSLSIRANTNKGVSWFLDGEYLGILSAEHQQTIPRGRHVLNAVTTDGSTTATVRFAVE